MRDGLLGDQQAREGGRYSELASEQTTSSMHWYDVRSIRIALCASLLVFIAVIVIIPVIISTLRGQDIATIRVPSSSTAAPASSPSSATSTGAAGWSSSLPSMPTAADWSSSSSSGIGPAMYIGNVTFAGMEGRQFGSDTAQHVVITMPNVFGVGRELYNLSQTFAEHGYRVYAMDIFRGEPMPRRWDPTWWDRHLYNNTVADMVTVLDDIYANAASFASLQVVGYCYGGGVAAGLTAVERPVLSAVSAHPTWEDLQGNSELGELETLVDNTSSLFFIMPYNDPQFNNQAMRWINASINRDIETQYKLYKNTQHGFAFDLGGSSWKAWNWTQRASATRDTLYWLDTHRQQ